MEKLQLVGFGDVDEQTKTRVTEIAQKQCKKFDRHFEEYQLALHLKGLHAAEKDKKQKYELKVHLQTPKKKFTSSDTEWDLVKLAHATLESMEREVEHAKKK
jgi:ribosome-associated translation inhibitor RaiA